MRQRIDLRVPEDELEALDELAAKAGKTRTDLFVLAIRGLAPEILDLPEDQ